MNIATINTKGQIVIPKPLRKALGILPKANFNVVIREGNIQLQPIKEVYSGVAGDEAFLALLKKTRGSWGSMTKQEKLKEARRRKLELAASRRRKNAW